MIWGLLLPSQLWGQEQDLSAFQIWKAGTQVTSQQVAAYGEARCFSAEALSDAVFKRMQGKSYPHGCTVKRSDLRYLRVLHYDAEGHILLGEMVCNKAIAADLVSIFHELYRNKYPIERMVLIDDYDAKDELSMRANNSSSFCFRRVAGSKKLSKHSLGLAVDLNTRYNPYCRKRRDGSLLVLPSTSRRYCNRKADFPYKIVRGDLCYRLFRQHGFKWGGNWRSCKDYQHFEK